MGNGREGLMISLRDRVDTDETIDCQQKKN